MKEQTQKLKGMELKTYTEADGSDVVSAIHIKCPYCHTKNGYKHITRMFVCYKCKKKFYGK